MDICCSCRAWLQFFFFFPQQIIIFPGCFLHMHTCRDMRKTCALFYKLMEILIFQQIRHGMEMDGITGKSILIISSKDAGWSWQLKILLRSWEKNDSSTQQIQQCWFNSFITQGINGALGKGWAGAGASGRTKVHYFTQGEHHRIIKFCKIGSNHSPSTAQPTTDPCPKVPHPWDF